MVEEQKDLEIATLKKEIQRKDGQIMQKRKLLEDTKTMIKNIASTCSKKK